jgi:hypothetical protein
VTVRITKTRFEEQPEYEAERLEEIMDGRGPPRRAPLTRRRVPDGERVRHRNAAEEL